MVRVTRATGDLLRTLVAAAVYNFIRVHITVFLFSLFLVHKVCLYDSSCAIMNAFNQFAIFYYYLVCGVRYVSHSMVFRSTTVVSF